MFKLLLLIVMLTINSQWVYAPPGGNREVLTAKYNPKKLVERIAYIKGVDKSVLLAIWQRESSSKVWVDRGESGEYSAFQIMPETGKRLCHGRWKTNFIHSAMCSSDIILDAMDKCDRDYQVWNKYNTGSCLKKATGYAQDIQQLIMKQKLKH